MPMDKVQKIDTSNLDTSRPTYIHIQSGRRTVIPTIKWQNIT
jgi:hypothetical protein